MGWQYQLNPWHYWGQRWDPSPEPDPDRFYNCGPECLAMCGMYWFGWDIQAAIIHDYIHGRDYLGGTTVDDMKGYLEKHMSVPTHILQVSNDHNGKHQLLTSIILSLKMGHPVIGLRAFAAPYQQPLHYGVITGVSPQGLVEADPWEGVPRHWSYNDYWNWSWNTVLLPQRKRSI